MRQCGYFIAQNIIFNDEISSYLTFCFAWISVSETKHTGRHWSRTSEQDPAGRGHTGTMIPAPGHSELWTVAPPEHFRRPKSF